jgi:hypothetical protein
MAGTTWEDAKRIAAELEDDRCAELLRLIIDAVIAEREGKKG